VYSLASVYGFGFLFEILVFVISAALVFETWKRTLQTFFSRVQRAIAKHEYMIFTVTNCTEQFNEVFLWRTAKNARGRAHVKFLFTSKVLSRSNLTCTLSFILREQHLSWKRFRMYVHSRAAALRECWNVGKSAGDPNPVLWV